MREITIPISDGTIRELKVGEPVMLSGVMMTGRDAVHKWMIETFIKKTREPQGDDLEVYQAIKPLLDGGIIYHCGPVVEGLESGPNGGFELRIVQGYLLVCGLAFGSLADDWSADLEQ